LSITDVLDLSIAEAAEVFGAVPRLARIFRTLVDVGLGYLPVGQPSTTLSGGEAQRIKLATELARPATGRTLYLLDEPTTGLHFEDVAMLLAALQRLVDAGNSVVVVEHHTDLVKSADWIVDLGPEGGGGGGRVVGEGTPETIARLDTPTGLVVGALPELAPERPLAHDAVVPYVVPRVARARSRPDVLSVRGARMHNLRGVDVDIPHHQMTVITGVSGSGKTSLAFDTIFAEGQRQYVESLSTYARRFLGRLERAPVDHIEGLQPAIAIDQRAAGHNPRSTGATGTEIHDLLRLLYARIGRSFCPTCDRPIEALAPAQAAAALRKSEDGPGWLVATLPPAVEPAARRAALVHDGWTRIYGPAGEVALADPEAEALLAAGAGLVVDRLAPARSSLARLVEAVETAYRLGNGGCRFVPRDGRPATVWSSRAACPDHGMVHEGPLTPRHFSFNARLGACPRCDGVGTTSAIVRARLLPRPELPFWEAVDARVGAVLARSARSRALVEAVLDRCGVATDVPVSAWGKPVHDALLDGVDEPLVLRWSKSWGSSVQRVEERRPWPGLLALLDGWSSKLEWLVAEQECPRCHGGRLRPALLAVRIEGQSIADLCALPVVDAAAGVGAWRLSGADAVVAERPLSDVRRRLGFLCDVGLGYLSLDRAAETLSGGEAQRIRLASQLGSALCGVTYVLDEPTVGLHPRDTERLLGTLEGLRDQGNTVVLVEHDPETIDRADHVIDLGPGAGRHGGRVVATGTATELRANPASLTGRWLSGAERLPDRGERRTPRAWLTLRAPTGHNLRCGDVAFPTGVWVGVSGVSGSGKSTLVLDTLGPALEATRGGTGGLAGLDHRGLDIGERVDRVIVVDQSPIGRTPRSTPATYTKVLDPLRALFASLPGALQRGWKPGRFSFNARGGRCEACEGRGAILVEMHFLPDVWVTCDTCGGKRFDRDTLDVRWQGKSIADVLAMRADEAYDLFRHHRTLARPLKALVDVGLDYVTLGQPATTLSGGEAQRVKLAAELSSRRGHAVYILDEPTTGLHMADVARLVTVLHRLVDDGHTVITVEHHVGMLSQADWMIDLGPEGGDEGGLVIASGTPEDIVKAGTATGRALKKEDGRGLRNPRQGTRGKWKRARGRG
jgi:excinuclease ABC subunit A